MNKTRREFLQRSLYLVAGLWAAGCGSSSFSSLTGQAPLPSVAFEPPSIASKNGLLQTTLRCVCAENVLNNGRRVYTRTYNEALVGPTLRLRPGDTLKIDVQNDLPVSEFDDPLCGPGASSLDSNIPNSPAGAAGLRSLNAQRHRHESPGWHSWGQHRGPFGCPRPA